MTSGRSCRHINSLLHKLAKRDNDVMGDENATTRYISAGDL